MNLLKLIDTMEVTDTNSLSKVIQCFEERLNWLEVREPESQGDIYDQWEEKCSYLENAIDGFQEAYDLSIELNQGRDISIDLISEKFNEGKDAIEECQSFYGGLSRLTA